MNEELKELERNALAAIENAGTEKELQDVRVRFLGKKGEIGRQMATLKELPHSQRKAFGKALNELKGRLTNAADARKAGLEKKAIEEKIMAESLDITLPGFRFPTGSFHPLTRVWHEITDIFTAMGFDVVEGPEIETEWYNFEALNLHAEHPARDEQDSFYLDDKRLLRTQTSPVQIRVMEQMGSPPVQIVAPGRVFRRDATDASHSPVFHQIEGLVVDKNITMGHLKATLEAFNKEVFGKDVLSRFRPDYFPFTEPSCEVAISCIICGGEGCGLCKRTGWIEILGAGMVHPQVLKNAGFDSKKYSGFAFGIGIDRVAMLKYSIDDIRLLYENDIRFLKQF